jgi:phosphinothricin acetyltransferase
MKIRLAVESDAEALASIYGHHVLNGLGTFEETPPSPREMASRLAAVQSHGLPWLVAEDGEVAGYAYVSPFRTRAAYRFVVEDSVYVAPGRIGQGVGRALLSDLISRCEAMGRRQMIAIIGDSENLGSIALHAALGFTTIGVAPAVGWKRERWVDVVWMQRPLGPGAATPPQP